MGMLSKEEEHWQFELELYHVVHGKYDFGSAPWSRLQQHRRVELGIRTGFMYPCGLRVRVPTGTGTGQDQVTRGPVD